MDTHVAKMVPRSSRRHGNRQLVIPAAIGRTIPSHTEWEITVVKDGLHLRYLGEYTPEGTGGPRVRTVDLPFLNGDA